MFKHSKPVPPFKVMKPYILMALPAAVVFCVILFLPRHRISPRPERTLASYPQIYQERYARGVSVLSQDTDSASATTAFSTTAPLEEVFAWYEAMYTGHGWVKYRFSDPEKDRFLRDWEYRVDVFCSLVMRVEHTPGTQTYTHTLFLTGKYC